MDHVANLPAKLELMLKAASISRVALAQRLGVDKSLVSRWISGAVHPGEHNLSRLSTLLAEAVPGFRLADWDESIQALCQRYDLVPPLAAPAFPAAIPAPMAAFLEAARPEITHRAAAYEGFWRSSRPSVLMPDRIFHEYGVIRRTPDGLVEVLMQGSGLDFSGWLFPFGGNVFVFLFDSTGRTPMNVLFRGVSLPRAVILDGILQMAALDPGRTPAAVPIIIERVGDLGEDRDADIERLRQLGEEPLAPGALLDEAELRSRLIRDIGPAAAMAGGEMFLTVDQVHGLSRGEAAAGLRG